MLKRIRRRIEKNKSKLLVAVFCATLSFSAAQDSVYAALSNQVFNNGQVNVIPDNIVVNTGYGLYVYNNGTSASMNGLSITTDSNSFGVYANNFGSINLTNVDLRASACHSVIASGNGTIVMNGGSIINTNTASWFFPGIPSYVAVGTDGGRISLNNVTIQAAGIALDTHQPSGIINVDVNGQSISAPILMYLSNGGTIDLTASSGSQIYGKTLLSGAGNTANLTLNSSAAWTMPDTSPLTNLSISGGIVKFTPPSSGYKTLTVNNNLSGSGGTFYLNTNLAAGQGDCLVIGGNTSGSHNIYITNQGGVSSANQALKVVNLDSSKTNTATFSGGSDSGIYRYGVAQGASIPGYSGVGSATEDYYFYNTLTPSTAVRAASSSVTSTNVTWYGEMNEIKKRMGDLRTGKQSSDDFWVRTYADKYKVSPAGNDGFEQTVHGVEIGKDNPQSFTGGKKFTGFVAGTARADNSFDNKGGNGETNSFYLGAYGSWLRDDGSYFDLIGKYNWFRNNYDTQLLGGGSDSAFFKNRGVGLSAEIGKRFERGNGVYVEPAAELSTMWSTKSAYTTANGINIENPESQSVQLRLGYTVGKKWSGKDGATRQVYGKASWLREFKGESQTVANNVTFDSDIKGNQLVTGIGFIEDTGKHQYYVDLEKSWGNRVDKAWGVNAGMRWKF